MRLLGSVLLCFVSYRLARGADQVVVPGQRLAASLSARGSRCYSARLVAGTFARFTATQDEADLALDIYSLSNALLVHADSAGFGSETASLLVTETANYRVCVARASEDLQSARYSLRFDTPRASTPDDEMRLQAERLTTEARRLAKLPGRANKLKAIEKAREGLLILERLADTEARVATLIGIGDALFASGDPAGARAEYNRALQINPPSNLRAAAEALTNAAVASRRLGDIEAARQGFDRSLKVLRQIGYAFGLAATENNAGLLALNCGRAQEALDHYLAALPVMHRTDQRAEGLVMGNIAVAYMVMGEYGSAESFLRRSLPLLAHDKLATGKALINLGRVRGLAGDLPGAEKLLVQADGLLRDTPAEGEVENNLGQVMFRRGDVAGSWPHLNKALEIYRQLSDVRGQGSATHWTGVVQAAQGKPHEALVTLEEALRLRISAGVENDEAATLLEIARVQRRLGKTDQARQSLDQAIRKSEDLRVRVAAPDLRAAWFSSNRAIYEELIDLLMALHQPAAALIVSERARARSLADGMGTRRQKLLQAGSPALRQREQQVVASLSFKSQQLSQLPAGQDGDAQRANLLREVSDLELEHQRLDGEIATSDPRRAALAAMPPIRLNRIQELLGVDTALVEYSIADGRSYVFVVTSGELKCFELPGRAQIENTARVFVKLAGSRTERLNQPALEQSFKNSAAALSRVLLAPILPSVSSRRIIFALDGILHDVPLAALPDPAAPGTPLGVSHEILNVPSAAILDVLRQSDGAGATAPFRIALFADPVFGGDPRIPTSSATRAISTGPARLPFSLQEAGYIAEATKGYAQIVIKTGFTATKDAVARETASGPAILHLATHARIDDSRPELSGIYLAMAGEKGEKRDGLLSLYEIYDLRLPVGMVVLSACQTGLGRLYGEGLAGFSRALFFAGTSRVVASLWPVDDEGTALFMREFYRHLVGPSAGSPASALRAAREWMWKTRRWHDESYWSGFVLEGDWRAIAGIRGVS